MRYIKISLAIFLAAFSAQAVPVYTGGIGGVSFGVTPYGLPVPGTPTYILNNFNGRFDILSSPGGTFLTANPVVANNIASFGPGPLPGFGTWTGGGNGWGPFGSSTIAINGPQIGYNITDTAPGSGSASYAIGTWSATFNEPAGYVGGYGTYLSISGSVPAIGNAAVAALRTHITSANPASPFFNGGLGIELPQLVLANSQTGLGVFSFVALGGSGAAMLTDIFGNFRGLAINNFGIAIPAGDVFTAESTLTIYADPAMIFDLDPLTDPALMAAVGVPLPQFGVVQAPEPATGSLLAVGFLVACVFRSRRNK